MKNMKQLLSILSIFVIFCAQAFAVTNYVSINEEWNGGVWWAAVQDAIMMDVDLLDDDWRTGFAPGSTFETYTFSGDTVGGIEGNYGTEYFDMNYSNGTTVRVERKVDDGSWFSGTVCATNSNPRIDAGSDLQDKAPKPYSLSWAWFWNEPSGCTSTQRNAIFFTFSGTPIDWFGFWLGDVESRSADGSGAAADIRYFDSAWSLISTGIIFAASWVDQTLCGWDDPWDSESMCGNETTRFVWFEKSSTAEDIKYMMIVVWDDDDPWDGGTTDGKTEHLSFIWPTIVEQAEIPDLALVKTWSTVAMSGDTIWYMLLVANLWPGSATWVVVEDNYPTWFTYVSASPVPTSGNNIRSIGSFASGAIMTINITGTIAGMTWSYTNTARVSADVESGSVSNTGTHVTDIVCVANYDTVCTGGENICGDTLTGSVLCDGSCSADTPTDPKNLWSSCNAWVGECAATGSMICNPDGDWVVCNAVAGTPSADICDGLDNDCDGVVDEDFVSQATNCGVWACQSSGTIACIDGTIIDSCMAGEAGVDTVCNGIDDDCDGSVDEDFVVSQTSCGLWVCASTGQEICQDWAIVNTCTETKTSSDIDTCDGLDNDCDGTVDEDFVATSTTCGVGMCGASGMTSCIAWVMSDSCVVGDPSAEVCDTNDNDCDGETDEWGVCAVSPPPPEPPKPPVQELLVDIYGTIYYDDENDDVYSGDTGISWQEVRLLDGSGNIVATVYTDSNGEYAFEQYPAGDYDVVYLNTSIYTSDSDIDGWSVTFINIPALSPGEVSEDNDFWLIKILYGTAGGTVITNSPTALPLVVPTPPTPVAPVAEEVALTPEEIEIVEEIIENKVTIETHTIAPAMVSTFEPIALPAFLPKTGGSL